MAFIRWGSVAKMENTVSHFPCLAAKTKSLTLVVSSSIPSILFCGFYELLHNKCASYVDAHELI
jgi:hypothetical protein